MEFADLDDDLFGEERQRGNADAEYSARFCQCCWFLDATPDLLVSEEDKLSVQKHCADYFYFKKDYEAAIVKYEDILSILPIGNTTVRRECYEGISRSYIKIGTYDQALLYAKKLYLTSRTVEQMTVSCSVMIDACTVAGEYLEGIKTAQILVSLHHCNSDAWLKLAWSYASLYNIDLPYTREHLAKCSLSKELMANTTESEESETSDTRNLESKLTKTPYSIKSVTQKMTAIESDSCGKESSDLNTFCREALHDQISFTEEEKGLQYVCACLFRSFTMLKRTEGTTFGFALDSSLVWQKKIQRDLEYLLDEKSLAFVRLLVVISDDIYSSSSPLKESTPEFVDRGSSKFQSDDTEANVEEISRKSFEKQWFKWII